ncbi:MAG: hypothetical protein AB2A00_14960 [Myxococcota bacterium]
MRRKLLIVALTLGTVGGYTAGFMSLRCHARSCGAYQKHSPCGGWDAERAPSAERL